MIYTNTLFYYRYQSEDRSLISKYLLKPFWAMFAKIFPLWMAPNVITLLGLVFIICNVLTVLYFDPNLDKETPRWTYFSYALGLFLYQTFDACDGSHARRTGQSGPLGELFDHCIDSLNTTLSMLVFCSVISTGYSFLIIVYQCSLLCNFYLSTWEEYHTHKLFLSEFSGPVEGILIIIISFILTGIYGPQKIWHSVIFQIFWKNTIISIESSHIAFIFCTIPLAFNIWSARRNVIQHYNRTCSSQRISNIEIKKSTLGLLPFFIYFGSVLLYSLLIPDLISFPFILNIGITMAFTVGRIIVSHLTHQSYPMFNPPMFIPTIQFLLYYLFTLILGYKHEELVFSLNWFGFGLVLGIHAMFITEVIYEFTNYLDIYTLSIKHPKLS